MSYKISVIVIVFNVESYLEEALDSILNQSLGHEQLEVLMVDDASTDSSGEIIDQYAAKYDNFQAIHLPENSGGCGRPRNVGIDNATGEYIMFLDSDDYYANDICEVLYNTITQAQADVASSKYIVFSDETEHKVKYRALGSDKVINIKSIDEDVRLLTTAPSVWTKIYSRKLIYYNQMRFTENILAEDMVFVLEAFLKADGIVFLNDHYGYYYRNRNIKGDESLSRKKNRINLMGMAKGYAETYQVLIENGKKKYYPMIFVPHLEFWMEGFIVSDTTPAEKRELLEYIAFLYENLKEFNAHPDKEHREHLTPLFDSLSNRDYDQTILIAKIYLNFINTQNYLRRQLELNTEQLELKKKQVAELQTVTGYCEYKTKNIVTRLKNKATKS